MADTFPTGNKAKIGFARDTTELAALTSSIPPTTGQGEVVQADRMLTIAKRNLRRYLSAASFKCEADHGAAMNCLDVLEDSLSGQEAQVAVLRSAFAASEQLRDRIASEPSDHRLAFSHPSPRNVENLPANDLTVPELLAERSRIEKLWDDMRGSDEELGGGSPGEWMIERLDEIDTTIKRLSHPSCEVERLREAAQVVLEHRIGEFPGKGWLRDNDSSRKALHALAAALRTPETVSLKGDRV